jgi:hypothetical protein
MKNIKGRQGAADDDYDDIGPSHPDTDGQLSSRRVVLEPCNGEEVKDDGDEREAHEEEEYQDRPQRKGDC